MNSSEEQASAGQTRYRPLLELGVGLVVSVASVLIAVATCEIARQSNWIANQQLEAEKSQLRPVFDVRSHTATDSLDGGATESLYVYNFGGPALRLNVEPVALVTVSTRAFDGSLDAPMLDPHHGNEEKWMARLADYYAEVTYSTSDGGLVSIISGSQDNAGGLQMIAWSFALISEGISEGNLPRVTTSTFEQYLKLTFDDVFGDSQVQYFRTIQDGPALMIEPDTHRARLYEVYHSTWIRDVSLSQVRTASRDVLIAIINSIKVPQGY